MSENKRSVEAANDKYAAEFGDNGELPMPPARRFAVLTCMDARLDPAKFAGLSEGDAHVIRNAGGRASDDAIRSLVISHKLLGTNEWFVIHHTDCGMETFTSEVMGELLEGSLDTANVDETGWSNPNKNGGTVDGKYINWLEISDLETSVLEDVKRIKTSNMVPGDIPVFGYIYNCKSGKLVEVPSATEAGAAS
ncbi:carbonic anhydrase [Veronia nyctiphanis]|uniref:Carbonic anhydrase n=1 Tax=Veronia nyctiphanis TaxID=1278244 RepID=A0A4Q0YVE5_9GAMM|nr:carbonic anhydrase [Veronia nyctiphanis]RXJ74184.1 carbonic anhydrase [Veronia nyctiphanis]